eukprot:scaffold291105_cov20-Tisochrysis_lutea.AAC.1
MPGQRWCGCGGLPAQFYIHTEASVVDQKKLQRDQIMCRQADSMASMQAASRLMCATCTALWR